MSNPSVEELLAWMNNRSRTQGWSAIVAYDRTKANDLLTQLYIERFNSSSYLPSLSEELDHGDGSINTEHVYDLTFAVPQLHFESADLDESRVEVSLDFIGGMIISEYRPTLALPRIDKVQKVLPLNRPQLTMSVLLGQGDGQVGEKGEVTLDISEGSDFRANFVVGSLSQQDIGDRFRLYFKQLLEEGRVLYPLGRLEGENGVLTPEHFELRTMPAPGATRREAENYRDGAIILFVKLREGTAGGIPGSGSDFKYPLPVAKDGTPYSGAMWLSNRTLMEKLIRNDIQGDIGYGITFEPFSGSGDVPWTLTAISGGLEHIDMRVEYEPDDETANELVALWSDWNYMFAAEGDGNEPLRVTTKDNEVDLSWKCEFTRDYGYKRYVGGFWDDYQEGDLQNYSNVSIRLAPVLDGKGVVHFQESERDIGLSFKSDRGLLYFFDNDNWSKEVFDTLIRDAIFPTFESALKDISIPAIDTFLVRNLLFPGHNALRPDTVYVPGDLTLFGRIDPQRTSFKITPLHPTMEAGSSQLFKTEPQIAGVTWSLTATDDEDLNIGTIDANGLYKAAPASALVQGYQRVKVTARARVDGVDVTSSALVSVVESTVSVAPLFQVCSDGQTITLTAETLSGKDPEWSLKDPSLGGSLSVAKGRECIYTPPPLDDPDRPTAWPDIVLVKNPDTQKTTEAVILVVNYTPSIPVIISKDSDPASGKVQLQVFTEQQGPMDPIDARLTPYLVAGPGSISAEGVYTEPANASGIAVVSLVRETGPLLWNYIVMPLPLATYGELIRDVVDVMLSRYSGPLPSLDDRDRQ